MQELLEYPTIAAVIVTYQPEPARLQAILDRLRPQCRIVVVDNGESPEYCEPIHCICSGQGIPKLPMGGNKGIAAAQNAGIRWAIEQGATHVLLLDDDSLAPLGLVRGLREALDFLAEAGRRIACVGARALDETGRNLSSVPRSSSRLSPCTNLTSSGSLIPVEVIRDVGLMDEALFIDCVDYDWGWRAQEKGYTLFLANEMIIGHRLGLGQVELLGLRIGIPSPIRHYYQYRNIPRMLMRPYVPTRWKIKQILSLLLKPVFAVVFLDRKAARLGYMGRGVLDSLRGRQGRYAG